MTEHRAIMRSDSFFVEMNRALFSLAIIGLCASSAIASDTAIEKTTRQLELQQTEQLLQSGSEERSRLQAEIETLRNDRARLNQRLIETSDRIRATELRIGAVEERLVTLSDSEAKARASLEGRKAVATDILAALQRVGTMPPPILIADPDHVLDTVRSAILLGSVVPDLKAETDKLAEDLAAIERIRSSAAAERDGLARDVQSLVRDRQDITLLVEARQRDISGAESRVEEQAKKAETLAAKSQTLKDLIGRLETEVDSVSRAARDAKTAAVKADEEVKAANDPAARDARNRMAALAFRDPARQAPKVGFGELKGLLPLPVSGMMIRGFNARDPVGGLTRGVTFEARPGALVSAPSDGWVAFAGPFRTYGQLLILNMGGGYYILLAGMDRISVSLGQFVLAGEPVAVMGDPSKDTQAQGGANLAQPVLYVEFRKEGTPVDPTPWWSSVAVGKGRG
jgi:murein hydrolase activator